jgi:ATP-dependent RNA helicase DOB1
VPVPLPLVTDICTLRISIPGDLRPPESRRAVLLTLRELLKKYPPQHVLPLLDPVADMGIQDERVEAALAGAAAIRQQLATNPIWRVSGVVGSSREVPGVEWVGTGTYMHACCGCTPVLLR